MNANSGNWALLRSIRLLELPMPQANPQQDPATSYKEGVKCILKDTWTKSLVGGVGDLLVYHLR
jgi:hypothetical protein